MAVEVTSGNPTLTDRLLAREVTRVAGDPLEAEVALEALAHVGGTAIRAKIST